MAERGWLESEPRWGALPAQAFELLRRGVRRPLALLLASFVLTLMLAGAVVFAKRGYAPRLVLRVVEANRDPGTMPELKRKLADYVREGVFTTGPLFELIQRHRLYPKLAASDRQAAVQAFRRDIDVDVYHNYFVEQRSGHEEPRSARVAISYRALDRQLAVQVTRDLGALVIARESALRREQALRAAKAAQHADEALRAALSARVEEAALKQAELSASAEPDPTLQVELISLLGSIGSVELQADAAARRAAALDLGARYEQRGMGLSFEIADDAGIGVSSHAVRVRLVVSVLAYLLALPLMVMAVGAFVPKRGVA